MASMQRAFNNHIDELVDDMLRVVPGDPDVLAAQAALAAARRMNVSALVRAWPEYTEPYRRQIESGDVAFFLTKDYAGDIPVGTAAAEPIRRLRARAAQLTPEQQAKVMKYVQNLTTLAKLYSQGTA
jgi:hypothetical protein